MRYSKNVQYKQDKQKFYDDRKCTISDIMKKRI